MEFGLVEQEGIMTLVGDNFDKTYVRGDGVQGTHNCAALRRWEQPIGRKRDEAESHRRAFECRRKNPIVFRREVEVVHGARDVEIGVGVKPVDERVALMAQITLYLKIGVEA